MEYKYYNLIFVDSIKIKGNRNMKQPAFMFSDIEIYRSIYKIFKII